MEDDRPPQNLNRSRAGGRAGDLPPVIVRCGYGGKLLRHGLPDSDEHGGIFGVDKTQFFADRGIGLRGFDDEPRHFYGELSTFFGGLGKQGVAWDQLDGFCGGVHKFRIVAQA